MRKLNRETWWSIGVGVLLVLLTIVAAIQSERAKQATLPLAAHSSQPNGARALWLWLQALGYATDDTTAGTFALPKQTAVVLMLEPYPPITGTEWKILDKWIDAGGTLVLAGQGIGSLLVGEHFDFYLTSLPTPVVTLTAQVPVWLAPPVTMPVTVNAGAYWVTQRRDFVSHLATDDGPVVVSFTQGKGRVILSAAAFPFTNAGLKVPGNPEFVLNVVAPQQPSGPVWFDEWHHGRQTITRSAKGPGEWLRTTPSGHALLYTLLVLYLTLIVRGRLFGRPVPLPQQASRRAPLEYITALANLRRQAGQRTDELRYNYEELKRKLGQRYRLSPDLPDEEYVAQLGVYNPNLDTQALLRLLTRLRRPRVSEGEMVELAGEAAKWLKGITH